MFGVRFDVWLGACALHVYVRYVCVFSVRAFGVRVFGVWLGACALRVYVWYVCVFGVRVCLVCVCLVRVFGVCSVRVCSVCMY